MRTSVFEIHIESAHIKRMNSSVQFWFCMGFVMTINIALIQETEHFIVIYNNVKMLPSAILGAVI